MSEDLEGARRRGFSWQKYARELGRENAAWRARLRGLQAAVEAELEYFPNESIARLVDALEQSNGRLPEPPGPPSAEDPSE